MSKQLSKSITLSVTVEELFQSGAHIGHKTSHWNPSIKNFLHSSKSNTHIIDLFQSIEQLEAACQAVYSLGKKGQKLLFVGTKSQAAPVLTALAKEIDAPYVTKRWPGGLLTNFETISSRLKKLTEMEKTLDDQSLRAKYTKRELGKMEQSIKKLNTMLGGIKGIKRPPQAVFVVDTNLEKTAVQEATKLGLTTIAIVDTNSSPKGIDYPIVASDDNLKVIELIAREIQVAYQTGYREYLTRQK
ncbi:30S ribosomal protein S2 [Candidatus Saccharibacteria bacterium]|nr:30S ribosomal protein S2 [Candidatus Saccharibacteria bacterium]MCB9834875.1 30S ribosomal protein S2 [Candidatus Nomurabacteria bacterium]